MDISQLIEVIPGIIIFKISGVEFCINVKDVYVIKRAEEFEHIKDNNGFNGSAYVTLYNINIPIIDISKNFNIPVVNGNGRDHRMILIIRHHSEEDELEKTFGITVDEVVELITTEDNDDSYLLKFVASSENPFLSGSIFLGTRQILLPNFSKIAASVFLTKSLQ